MQDVRNNPFIRDLLSVALSGLLLGSGTTAKVCIKLAINSPCKKDFAFSRLPNLTYNILAGTSVGVGQHIFQWYWNKRFTAFDYGRKGNLKAYGSRTPTDFSQHYVDIDIPVRQCQCRRPLMCLGSFCVWIE